MVTFNTSWHSQDLPFKSRGFIGLFFFPPVIDNESPRLKDCPIDQEAFADSTNYTTVNWTAPTVEDNSMAIIDLTPSNSSGTSFPVGTTLVTYTATDPSGNSDTCSFNVTVYCK